MTWWRDGSGHGVFFNRDEKKTRGPAEPPVWRAEGFLAPRDLDGGGAWLTVNRQGLILGLLNRWSDSTTPSLRSRGLLVWELAALPDVASLAGSLEDRPLACHAPFTLVALDEREEARWDWDGRLLKRSVAVAPVTSSSWRPEDVIPARERAFARLERRGDPVELERYHSGGRPTPFNVRMLRPDAQTWSRSRIEVTASHLRWDHWEEFPEMDAPPEEIRLELARLDEPQPVRPFAPR